MEAVLRLRNIHPGEILREHYLLPFGIRQSDLARLMQVPSAHIREVVRGQRAISVEMAMRLCDVLKTPARYWLGLQMDYDLEEARRALGRPAAESG